MASLPISPLNLTLRSIFFIIIAWIGLLCVADCRVRGAFGGILGGGGSKQREFDYFKLALQWPGTFCRRTRHCCSSNGCCQGSNGPTGFTIHGLWADYNDGTWPSCCNGKKFDANEVETLLDALNKYWPSLSCGSISNCHGGKGLFWEHEWEKHGTCSFSVTGDEHNYFLTTLNVYFTYNVTEVLREAGYVASNSEKYPLGGIIQAIQNAFHMTPELECSGDALQELRLCFQKNFSPRDCAADSNTENGIVTSKKSCPDYISLPEYVSLKLGTNRSEVSPSTLQSSI